MRASAVHALLASFHQEFHDFVLQAAYGRILTRLTALRQRAAAAGTQYLSRA